MNGPSIEEQIRAKVREGYGAIARSEPDCGCGTSCCGSSPEVARELATRLGYDPEILATLPEGTNLGLSCGNPQAIASLLPGETVIDLGSGAGFDVFLAAQAVGPTGKAIGVDMTADMLTRARRNAASFSERTGLANVEFRLGEIEHLPVADSSVDVVLSNCVINLSPDKLKVWREVARVLKPGGRVAVSDIVLLRPLPEGVRELVDALVGCVAGASLVDDIERDALLAGLDEVSIKPKGEYVAAMLDAGDTLYQQIRALLPEGTGLADFIASADISARRKLDFVFGEGPGGSEEDRLRSPVPKWSVSSSCCAPTDAGCCT